MTLKFDMDLDIHAIDVCAKWELANFTCSDVRVKIKNGINV